MQKKAPARKKAPAKKAAVRKPVTKKKAAAKKATPKQAVPAKAVPKKPAVKPEVAHSGVHLPPVKHVPPAYSTMHQRDWAGKPPPRNFRMPKR